MSKDTSADGQSLLLLKTLHNETLSNWTGSVDDPVFDYLNIPLVKVGLFATARIATHLY